MTAIMIQVSELESYRLSKIRTSFFCANGPDETGLKGRDSSAQGTALGFGGCIFDAA